MQRPKIANNFDSTGTTLVLFFVRNNLMFPVVHAELFYNHVAEVTANLEKVTNAKFTGYTMSAIQWNSIVAENKDPVDEIRALMSEALQGNAL